MLRRRSHFCGWPYCICKSFFFICNIFERRIFKRIKQQVNLMVFVPLFNAPKKHFFNQMLICAALGRLHLSLWKWSSSIFVLYSFFSTAYTHFQNFAYFFQNFAYFFQNFAYFFQNFTHKSRNCTQKNAKCLTSPAKRSTAFKISQTHLKRKHLQTPLP